MSEGEQLTVPQVAARLGIAESTWRAYVARGQAPAPDGRYGARLSWWWSSTVDGWDAGRPGSGARTDRR